MPLSPSKVYLTRRSNGYYYVGYLEDGKRCWKSTRARTRHDALQCVRDIQAFLKERTKSINFSKFTQEFLRYGGGIYRPLTIEIYKRTFQYFTSLHGDPPLTRLTLKHADDYKAARAGEVSAVSVNMELRALKAALGVAVSWGRVATNPFGRLKQLAVVETVPVYLTQQDFQKLIAAVTERWLKEVLVFAACTGFRRGEIMNLKWADIDFQRRLIQIHSSPTFRTKAGKQRVVPMNNVVHAMLTEKWKRESASDSETDDAIVFTANGQAVTGNYVAHCFKRAVRKVGLSDRVRFHSLRHTFASWLAQDGVSLYAIQKLLGHSSGAVTQIYSHLQPEELHGVVARIEVPLN